MAKDLIEQLVTTCYRADCSIRVGCEMHLSRGIKTGTADLAVARPKFVQHIETHHSKILTV